jgi:hypothetical protein
MNNRIDPSYNDVVDLDFIVVGRLCQYASIQIPISKADGRKDCDARLDPTR